MAKQITTTVVIQGRDQLSPVVDKATAKTVKSLDTLQKRASAISAGAFGLARVGATIGTGITVPLAYAGKQAVDFEHQLAQLGKVANMDLGSKGLTQLGEQAKEIAPYLATMPGDVVKSMTALKQAGTGLDQLKDVAKFVGEAGVAFDMTAGKAGEAFGGIRAAMGLSIKEAKDAFDVINVLSNNMAATPERLVSFFTSGGAGVANALHAQAKDIAGYGATFIEMQKSGEEAATIMERVTKNIFSKKTLTNVFDKAGGGAKGLLAVIETGANIKDETLKRKYFALFGEYALDVRNLADNLDGPRGLRQAIGLVSTEEKRGGAVHKEFTSVMKSTLNQLKSVWTDLQVTVINFGTAALPVIKQLAADVKPVIADLGVWIQKNPELTGTLLKATAGLAAFSFAVSGISTLVGIGAKAVAVYTTVLGWFSAGGALAGVSAGLSTLATGMWAVVAPALVAAAPYLAAAAAVGVIGYAAYKAYDYFEGFHKIVITVTTAIQTLADKAWPLFKALATGDVVGAYQIAKAGVIQTQDNVNAHMTDWRKTHPKKLGPVLDDQRIKDIEDRRKVPAKGPDWLKNVEYNRKLRKDAEMRKLLNPSNVPGKPYYEPDKSKLVPRQVNQPSEAQQPKPFNWADPLKSIADQTSGYSVFGQPKEVEKPIPRYEGGTSISLTNNPVIQIQGNVTPENKKEIIGILDQNRYDLMQMIKDAQRPMQRTKLE